MACVVVCSPSETICKVSPSLWNSRLSWFSSWRMSNTKWMNTTILYCVKDRWTEHALSFITPLVCFEFSLAAWAPSQSEWNAVFCHQPHQQKGCSLLQDWEKHNSVCTTSCPSLHHIQQMARFSSTLATICVFFLPHISLSLRHLRQSANRKVIGSLYSV